MLQPEFHLAALAWLLTYALHSTLLLGAAWLVCSRGWVRSVRVKEVIWRTALMGGLFSASVQTVMEVEPFGGVFVLQEISRTTEVFPAPSAPGPIIDHARTAALSGPVARPFREGATSPRIAAGTLAGSQSAGFVWTEWALLGWAFGGVALLCLLALASRRLRLRLAGRRPVAAGPLTERLERLRLQAGLRRRVRLSVSEHLRAPVALGTLRPEICLPPRALDSLSGELQECMLAHELGHLRRFDPFWLELGRTLETLLFFQPLNRLAGRRLAQCSEFLCDEWAVKQTGDPVSLARCLTEVAQWLVGDRRPLPVCAMTGLRSPLGERVERILDEDRPADRAPGWLPPLGAGLLSATAMLAPGFAAPAVNVAGVMPDTDARTPAVTGAWIQQPGIAARPSIFPDRTAQEPRVPKPSAPVRSVSVPSAPVRSVSVPSAPAHSLSVPSAPVRSLSVPSAPVRSLSVPSAPVRSVSLSEVWRSVTAELDALDAEITSLQSEIEGRAVPYGTRARLNEIERKARDLFDKERRIRSLLDLWQARTPNTVDARESEESGDETR